MIVPGQVAWRVKDRQIDKLPWKAASDIKEVPSNQPFLDLLAAGTSFNPQY